MFLHSVSWRCLGADHLYFCVLHLQSLSEWLSKECLLLDPAVGLWNVVESVTDFTGLILLFVVTTVMAVFHPAQRRKPTFLQMSFQKSLHWLSFCSLPRRQCILLKVSSISTSMHLTFLTCTNTLGAENLWWQKGTRLGRGKEPVQGHQGLNPSAKDEAIKKEVRPLS